MPMPMPPATCSRLCHRDSAWGGVFARSAMSFVLDASVIDSSRYRLLLAFFSVKPFSFIKCIDARRTYSWQFMNKYGARVSPYRWPATMSNKSVSPSSEWTFTFVFYRTSLWVWHFLRGDHTLELLGAFNRFPDFFVQLFKIVVDSWKFTMLLLYILWDDWPILISVSNEQLQQELEYTLLKPGCHRWWISKMQSGL